MFGIGMPELILILAVALIVIGPKKLPDLAKSLGKALNEFKNATQDFKDSIDSEVKDFKKPLDDVTRDANRIEEKKRSSVDDVFTPAAQEKQSVAAQKPQDPDQAEDSAQTVQPEPATQQPKDPKLDESDENDRSNG